MQKPPFNYREISKWRKKGVVNFDGTALENNPKASLVMPDSNNDSPAFLVFENFEKILKWNRSLRFALAVCTLKEKFSNAL